MTETPLRILVIEDEVLIALELECLLDDLGHITVGVAGSSAEAIALAHRLGGAVLYADGGHRVDAWIAEQSAS